MTKGPDAFRTISEASDELGVPQHVLRFWETRFSFIRPMKRAGGRRFYRPHDIAILRGVRRLLHDDGLSIKSVQQLHRTEGVRRLLAAGEGVVAPPKVAALEPVSIALTREPVAPPAPIAPGSLSAEPPPAAEVASQEDSPRRRRTPADLSDLERRRLNAALQDLMAIKAEIDELLAQGKA